MASLDLHEHGNFTRLCRLLVDKGTEALRNTFDGIHSPANLPAVLYANKTSLLKLKPRVINDSQWDLLFPPSGNPDSKTFDVTLLTVLFRNICGLPKTGWGAMPVDADRSMQTNIVRIKLLRNEVAHVTSTRVDNATFEDLWKKISQSLIDLNIPQKDIDDLKTCPLGPKEDEYVGILKDWKLHDEGSLKVLESVESSIGHLTEIAEENRDGIKQLSQSDTNRQSHRGKEKDEDLLRKLAKHNFKGKINTYTNHENFLPGTREWLLKEVDQWFNKKEQESRILLLTAGPGFGKSIFSAKVCQDFKKKGKLAACHFCDFRNSNLRNPTVMLQSLASQMCENVVGFKEKLIDQLKRPHEVENLNDAFGIYLQNPLDELELSEPILIVIDGLDESAADNKNEIVTLIDKYFPVLPEFIKVLVTSRPEISIAKLNRYRKINIGNSNANNNSDLKIYLQSCLSTDRSPKGRKLNDGSFLPARIQHKEQISGVIEKLVEMCEGSFLYAHVVQSELQKRNDLDQLLPNEITEFLPKGLGSVYEEYFQHFEEELKAIMDRKFDILRVLSMLVASKGPLPLTFISRALGLAPNCHKYTIEIIDKVNVAVSCLLYVSDDLVTVFHKSVVDWLLAKGYKDHKYTVKVMDGDILLWEMCEQMFEEIKEKKTDRDLTGESMYALEHGFEHLISCERKKSYTWLVDVVIVYLLLKTRKINDRDILRLWNDVLRVNTDMTDKLRARISWHIVEYDVIHRFEYEEVYCQYLKHVLTYSPKGYFSENERNIAKSILAKSPQLVDVNYDRQVELEPLVVYADERFDEFTAVSFSNDKSIAAVGEKGGTVILLDLPSLVELWQYPTDYGSIPCCQFAPDDSLLLFGKLETALSIAERKEVPFFHSNKETFVSCGFSPNGKRLVTCDGSSTIKLWDIAKRSPLLSFYTDLPVSSCSFDTTGLFIIANEKPNKMYYEDQDPFCVWNAVTGQRCDERNKTGNGLLVCKRCFPATFKFPASKRSNVKPCHPRQSSEVLYGKWSTGIFNEVESHFFMNSGSLCAVENTHFSMVACWNHQLDIDSTMCSFKDNLWLYASFKRLVVFQTTQERSSGMPYSVLVYSISFSPDGSRLATCTSDGFVNVWNVDTSRVVLRFKCSQEESPSACWWSETFLFVFHVLNGIPTLSKYPMNASFDPLPSQRDMCHFPTEFVHLSTVIGFSEGFLVLKCKETNTVSVLDVKGVAGLQMVTLPEIEPNMEITVSPGCSFVFGSGEDTFHIWKRSEVEAPVYEVFFKKSLNISDIDWGKRRCCFTKDSKFAVVAAEGPISMPVEMKEFQIINLDTGDDEITPFNFTDINFKLFCCSGVVICATMNKIRILDMDTGACIATSFQRYLSDDFLWEMKLSPNETSLAIPLMNGDVEYIRLSIAQNPSLSALKDAAVTEWNESKDSLVCHILGAPNWNFNIGTLNF